MAAGWTLLERMAVGGDRLDPSTTEDLDALMESVRGNLVRLLNARHGLSEAMPDYGLPAFADLAVGSGDYVQSVREAILVAIKKYEPRLNHVRVSLAEEDDESVQILSFRIEAMLVGRTGNHRVFYETSMAGSGRFDVSEQ